MHSASEAFPPYLQPKVTFIDGVDLREMVTPGVRTESAAIPPSSPLSQGSRGVSKIQRKHLLVTPPRGPLNRLLAEQTDKNTEEYESLHFNPASNVDKISVILVRLSDDSASEDLGRYAIDSMDQETS